MSYKNHFHLCCGQLMGIEHEIVEENDPLDAILVCKECGETLSVSVAHDFWTELLDELHCASYDSSVDLGVLKVIEFIYSNHLNNLSTYYTQIATELSLDPLFVQMVQYLLCGKEFAEYGCSPRGCWLTNEGDEFFLRYKPYYESIK